MTEAMPLPPLANLMLEQAARHLGAEWELLREDLAPRLSSLARDVEQAARAIAAGRLSPEQAKALLQLQRLALLGILRHGRVMMAVRADRLVDGLLEVAGERLLAEAARLAAQRL